MTRFTLSHGTSGTKIIKALGRPLAFAREMQKCHDIFIRQNGSMKLFKKKKEKRLQLVSNISLCLSSRRRTGLNAPFPSSFPSHFFPLLFPSSLLLRFNLHACQAKRWIFYFVTTFHGEISIENALFLRGIIYRTYLKKLDECCPIGERLGTSLNLTGRATGEGRRRGPRYSHSNTSIR